MQIPEKMIKKEIVKMFEDIVKIKSNEFVEESIFIMYVKYELTKAQFIKGLEISSKRINKLKNYYDLMIYLSEILKNIKYESSEIERIKE